MYPLSNKGINEMNELDCMRAIVLQGGRAGLTNKGINQMNEVDCLREMVLRSSGGALVATTLVFSTQPGGAVAGEPFTQQPVITVRDQHGATLTSFTGDVTIVKLSGSGTLSGDTTVAAVAGVATFVDLELDAADDYVLRASIASPVLTVDSAEFEVASAGWALVVATAAGSPDGNGVTTSAINTTGADVIFAAVSDFDDAAEAVLTDSKGNSWTFTSATAVEPDTRIRIAYCINPVVGVGHTFTLTGTGSFPSLSVAAFSGVGATPIDQQAGAATTLSGATSIQPGSVTPSEDDELIVTAFSGLPPANVAINSSFIIAAQIPALVPLFFGSAIAYKIQTAAGAENPTWSWSGTHTGATRILTAKGA